MKILLVVLLIIALLPIGFIWSLNTLFGLGIEITWATYGAALLLLALIPTSKAAE